VGDRRGEIRGRLNQAQTLKSLGFYRRALAELETVKTQLQDMPPSTLTASGWRSLGDALIAAGEFEQAETAIKQSLAIAPALATTSKVEAQSAESNALLSLGNLYWVKAQQAIVPSQQDLATALEYYENAASNALDQPSWLKRPA
jgi:tetratricopeptide (TPR) repeat protein